MRVTLAAVVLCTLTPTLASAQSALPETDATIAVEQAPTPTQRALTLRAGAVRAACRETRSVDVWAAIMTPVLAGAGIGLSIYAFTRPPEQQNYFNSFLQAGAPGLILGAIGVPLGRGIIPLGDPLSGACRRALRPDADEDTIHTAEGLLRIYGEPQSYLTVGLLGGATVATGAAMAVAFALQSSGLSQIMGGIAAAVVAAWVIIPITPPRIAAGRFAQGRFTNVIGAPMVLRDGAGVVLGASF